jgi:hypothetical protein
MLLSFHPFKVPQRGLEQNNTSGSHFSIKYFISILFFFKEKQKLAYEITVLSVCIYVYPPTGFSAS